ncbi:hypothetical protein DESUT3_11760 [Desulfuromonas versatilis]|uniref:Uncharacterized protein n=1 Tax=Desulfuromonas versatilis TaxID=2802975 RepID=A0ABN6DVP8_9BACT|nr:hypothetical protein [Desulfuromonas versatilis]BCR04107.1 hypothetical protein DESUT3_11760 [Desulfuromonas versatilis]
MKTLLLLLMALMYPLKVLAGEVDEEPSGKYDAARALASEVLVRYAPDVEEAMRKMAQKIKDLTRYSGRIAYEKDKRTLLIETLDPDDRVVEVLRKKKEPPLVRWETRGNFEYVKGGLELNLSRALGEHSKIALRGLVTQEFFEPRDSEFSIQAKVTIRF